MAGAGSNGADDDDDDDDDIAWLGSSISSISTHGRASSGASDCVSASEKLKFHIRESNKPGRACTYYDHIIQAHVARTVLCTYTYSVCTMYCTFKNRGCMYSTVLEGPKAPV